MDELSLITSDVKAANALKEGEAFTAKVVLNYGRILNLETTVASPRPKVTLIGKSAQPLASSAANNLQLGDQDELPQNEPLTFSIHAQAPAAFSGDEKVEVGTIHGAYLTTLTLTSGLILEDSQVAVATLDTGKAFAASAWGPLRFRVIENGVPGDWQPLATLVRLPVFGDIRCPDSSDQPCRLSGSRLFLVDSVSNDPQFTHPTQVPAGFPGYFLLVPRPSDGQLYVKLHDDPSVVNSITFPAEALQPPPIATPAASSMPAAQTPNSLATGARSNPSSATTVGHGAVVSTLPKPSTNGGTPSAPAPGKTAPQSALPAAPPIAKQTPQSGMGATPSGSSGPPAPAGKNALPYTA